MTTSAFVPTDQAAALKIRDRREALHLTRFDLAREAQVSTTWLIEVEHGVLPRRSSTLPRVFEALDRLEAQAAEASRS